MNDTQEADNANPSQNKSFNYGENDSTLQGKYLQNSKYKVNTRNQVT